ncbi:hypothetical protein D3C81_1645610 [compost metagenome]
MPGMVLTEFGPTCQRPSVRRKLFAASAAACVYSCCASVTAAFIASLRSSIGVVPACAAIPTHSTRYQRTLWIPVTTPSAAFARSSTGPCSICSSTQEATGWRKPRCLTSAAACKAVSTAAPKVILSPSLTSRYAARRDGSTKALEPIAPGPKRLPSSLVHATTSIARCVWMPASFRAAITSSPASTP